jgi:MoxR-like ATPase
MVERHATMALIGRESELAALASALRDDRWLVILGEAGIGKTSLVRAAIGRSGPRSQFVPNVLISAPRSGL